MPCFCLLAQLPHARFDQSRPDSFSRQQSWKILVPNILIPGLEIADLIRGQTAVSHPTKSLINVGVQRFELGQARSDIHVLGVRAIEPRFAKPGENQVQSDVLLGSRERIHWDTRVSES
jgi:hypothetical protein